VGSTTTRWCASIVPTLVGRATSTAFTGTPWGARARTLVGPVVKAWRHDKALVLSSACRGTVLGRFEGLTGLTLERGSALWRTPDPATARTAAGTADDSPSRPAVGRSESGCLHWSLPLRSWVPSTSASPRRVAPPAAPRSSPRRARARGPSRDHGAVGDGVADDTAALQAALDALEPYDRLRLSEGRTLPARGRPARHTPVESHCGTR
jgi:hypothetical protein